MAATPRVAATPRMLKSTVGPSIWLPGVAGASESWSGRVAESAPDSPPGRARSTGSLTRSARLARARVAVR
jgi:hypothetical protein